MPLVFISGYMLFSFRIFFKIPNFTSENLIIMLKNIAYNIARGIAIILMLQTLYFKFSGAPESVYIFEKVGLESWGRWSVGILELITSVLLIIPRTVWIGGILTVGLMMGVVVIHLTILGIEVMGDKGQLFYYALITLFCGAFVVIKNKDTIFNEVLSKKTGKR